MKRTNRIVYEAGYCSHTERAERVRSYMARRGMAPEKYSIRDPLDDENVYSRYTPDLDGFKARRKREVVSVKPGDGSPEPFTSDERSRFYTWAWEVVKDRAYDTRWATTEYEALILTWEYVDDQL